mmetsp:Transcript_15142/g.22337  ORF Transcript_15142/g.22337 Transcript_15142/m.22337 type:complete len:249 (+) Transcript_15142:124-870(+)
MIKIIFVVSALLNCFDDFNRIHGWRSISTDSFSARLDKAKLGMIQKRTNGQLAQFQLKMAYDYDFHVLVEFRDSFIERFDIPDEYVKRFYFPRIVNAATGDLVAKWDSFLLVDYDDCTEPELSWPPSNSFYFLEIEQNADDYADDYYYDDYDDDNLTELFQNVECKVKQTFGAIYGLGVPVHIDIMRRTSYQRAFFKPLLKDAIVNVIICIRNSYDESKTKRILNEGFIALIRHGKNLEWIVPNKRYS